MLSLVAISLLSVPAASEDITINDKAEEGILEQAKTDLGDVFSFSSSESERRVEVSDHDSRTTSVSTPETREIELETSKGKMTKFKSANRTYTTVETPYGDLKTGYRNGEYFEEFEGVNRSRAEEVKTALKDVMAEKRKLMQRRKEAIIKNQTAEVSVEEDFNTRTINLTNLENEKIGLDGWKLISKKSKEAHKGYYIFESIELEEDEELVLGVEGESANYTDLSTSGIKLYKYGDKITMEDSWGNKITAHRYD